MDAALYREVSDDSGTGPQAIKVIALVALGTSIGAFSVSGGSAGDLIFVTVASVASWIVWTSIAYIVSAALLRSSESQVGWRASARATAFAQSPGVFRAFGAAPFIGTSVLFAVVWRQLAAMIVAVRQSFDYVSVWRVLTVATIGFIVKFLFVGL